jgi:CBS domain-containing protein
MNKTFSPSTVSHLHAYEIMKTDLVTLSADANVYEAVDLLIKHRISGAPVIDEDRRLLGVFSEKSVMKVLVEAAYEQVPAYRVDALMNPEPRTITEDTLLVTMAQIFLTGPARRLPVLRDGILVGQVSRRDVIQAATRLTSKHPPEEKHLLYLSALRSMADAPSV